MSLVSFATIEDLELRWRPLENEEKRLAHIKLLDATALITSTLKKSGIVIDQEDEAQKQNLVSVCCAIVKRSMSADSAEFLNASSSTQIAGSYSQTISYANPGGDLYLTSSEKKQLGGVKQIADNVPLFEKEEN
ncbi:MAG: hypothetical protein HUJ74_00375 [Lachnospiraceae bacterium]|nr:hypothetical protein [Lachnospiraceae bacterium]